MLGLIAKTVLVTIGCLVAADIAGVLACTVFDVLPLRAASPALAYVIWFVFGAFCGLFAYNFSGRWASPKGQPGDWSTRPSAGPIGMAVLITGASLVVALTALFYVTIWSHSGGGGEYYVPDSETHSLVFLVAVLGAMVSARFFLMPTPGPT